MSDAMSTLADSETDNFRVSSRLYPCGHYWCDVGGLGVYLGA